MIITSKVKPLEEIKISFKRMTKQICFIQSIENLIYKVYSIKYPKI